MNDADLSARLLYAMAAANDVHAALVSTTIDVLAQGAVARVEAKLVRKTRTLAFVSAEALSAEGARLASASAVYKLIT